MAEALVSPTSLSPGRGAQQIPGVWGCFFVVGGFFLYLYMCPSGCLRGWAHPQHQWLGAGGEENVALQPEPGSGVGC